MVLPVTAHAAFHKAAHYFDVEAVSVPVDTTTWKADVDAMAAPCDDRTILLVGSAVSYAHGVVDPIPELGRLALERDLLLHVDGCIGGFILPYFRRLGREVTDFDFAVPGVTSMSMDFHKYAYCPKGASVVLYRDAVAAAPPALRQGGLDRVHGDQHDVPEHQVRRARWPRPGRRSTTSATRATWTSPSGRSRRSTRSVAGIDAMDDLDVMGDPESNLIALTSDTVNVFDVVDEMRTERWYVQPQLGFAGSRENIHLSVGGASLPLVPELLDDLAPACDAAEANPTPPADDEIVALLHSLDPATLGADEFDLLLAGAGIGGDGDGAPEVPDRTAGHQRHPQRVPAGAGRAGADRVLQPDLRAGSTVIE